MRLVLISDTHTYHDELILPKGDVLIHAGDISSRGYTTEVRDFLEWFDKQDFEEKIFIAGNHDFFFENRDIEDVRKIISEYKSVTYLFDEEIIINGVKFYGTPWQPEFCNWAFNVQRGELHKKWNKIPKDVNVLITHGPPYTILDRVKPSWNTCSEQVGCFELLNAINDLKDLKLNVFGHIHEAYGEMMIDNVTFINASVLDERYMLVNEPKIFDIII